MNKKEKDEIGKEVRDFLIEANKSFYTQSVLEEAIKEILEPFIYHKYGKTYIGYKETEGALRVEGMVLQLEKVISNALNTLEKQKDLEFKKILNSGKRMYEIGFKDGVSDKAKEMRELITEEMNTCLKEGTPTSRLTSLYNKIK